MRALIGLIPPTALLGIRQRKLVSTQISFLILILGNGITANQFDFEA
jgi:hypothetical protein